MGAEFGGTGNCVIVQTLTTGGMGKLLVGMFTVTLSERPLSF